LRRARRRRAARHHQQRLALLLLLLLLLLPLEVLGALQCMVMPLVRWPGGPRPRCGGAHEAAPGASARGSWRTAAAAALLHGHRQRH
jgi:hypothetical protein